MFESGICALRETLCLKGQKKCVYGEINGNASRPNRFFIRDRHRVRPPKLRNDTGGPCDTIIPRSLLAGLFAVLSGQIWECLRGPSPATRHTECGPRKAMPQRSLPYRRLLRWG